MFRRLSPGYSLENPLKFFSFEEGTAVPDGTPEWIMNLIRESEEAKHDAGYSEEQDHAGFPEETPF